MADEKPPQPRNDEEPGPRPIPWKLVLWAAVAIYAVIFLLANSGRQEVSFVFFSVKTRLIWLILLSMALGAVLARIGPGWWERRKRRRNSP